MKGREFHGLIAIFLIYAGVYLLVITPVERKESLRPLYKAVSSQRTNGPIYLVNPSETTRGASFFYLGRKIPVLEGLRMCYRDGLTTGQEHLAD